MAGTGSQSDGGADRRERGMATWFVGVAFLVADLLVIFFAPAALRVGRQNAFFAVIAALAVIGCCLMAWGRYLGRRA